MQNERFLPLVTGMLGGGLVAGGIVIALKVDPWGLAIAMLGGIVLYLSAALRPEPTA